MIKLALKEDTQQQKANFLNFLKTTNIVTLFDLGNVDELAKKGELPTVSSGNDIPKISGIALLQSLRAKLPIARLIAKQFAAAGYGRMQQAVAIAAAIRETQLEPKAQSPFEIGLFQLSTRGLGAGYSLEQLLDPEKNAQLIVDGSNKYPAFRSATSIEDAARIFVNFVQRPSNPDEYYRFVVAATRAILEFPDQWLPESTR